MILDAVLKMLEKWKVDQIYSKNFMDRLITRVKPLVAKYWEGERIVRRDEGEGSARGF